MSSVRQQNKSGGEFFRVECRSPPPAAQGHPGLPYSATLLGPGSEVLGFGDEMSRDHNWEPRVLLFLQDADCAIGRSRGTVIEGRAAGALRGPSDSVLALDSAALSQGKPRSRCRWWDEARDWLTLPEQRLRVVTMCDSTC
jgi:hypothetical protein